MSIFICVNTAARILNITSTLIKNSVKYINISYLISCYFHAGCSW